LRLLCVKRPQADADSQEASTHNCRGEWREMRVTLLTKVTNA
jgi:hypothetical protein